MLNKTPKRSTIVLALSVLFIMSAIVPTSLAGKDSQPIVVVDYAAEGNVVHVTVRNRSRTSQTVNVVVNATVGGMNVRGFTPVSVFPKGEVQTVVGFAGVVEDVGSVGVSEDSSPI